ncbi:3'-5' exonuclease [Priestia megaterium]|uniref:3'-5' exonuclease n=1 Tax=Priestia megaterium TaxID=1404 RepID=UPI002FFD5E1C
MFDVKEGENMSLFQKMFQFLSKKEVKDHTSPIALNEGGKREAKEEPEKIQVIEEILTENTYEVQENPVDTVPQKAETHDELPKVITIEDIQRDSQRTYTCEQCGVTIQWYHRRHCVCKGCYIKEEEKLIPFVLNFYTGMHDYQKTSLVEKKRTVLPSILEAFEVLDGSFIRWKPYGYLTTYIKENIHHDTGLLEKWHGDEKKKVDKEMKTELKLLLPNRKPYREYIAFDLETTGLYPDKGAEIIEIAAVKVIDGFMVDTFQTLVKPNKSIPQKITKITGITNEDVKESPAVEEALPLFYKFVGHLPLVAHNTPFDKSFLDAYSPVPPKNKTDDTLAIARRKLKKEKREGDIYSFKLEEVASYFGYSIKNAHRAFDDVLAVQHIYEELRDYESF